MGEATPQRPSALRLPALGLWSAGLVVATLAWSGDLPGGDASLERLMGAAADAHGAVRQAAETGDLAWERRHRQELAARLVELARGVGLTGVVSELVSAQQGILDLVSERRLLSARERLQGDSYRQVLAEVNARARAEAERRAERARLVGGGVGLALLVLALLVQLRRRRRRLGTWTGPEVPEVQQQTPIGSTGPTSDPCKGCASERVRAVLDGAPDPVVVMDDTLRLVDWNAQAIDVFGWGAAELGDKAFSDLVPAPSGTPTPKDGIQRFLSHGDRTGFFSRRELTAQRRNGERFPLEVTMFPFRAADEVHFGAFLRDISQRRRAEQVRDEFFAMATHELRTPLTSLRGSVGLLLHGAGGELTEKGQELAAVAQGGIDRMQRLVDDLLDLGRAAAGRLKLDIRRVNPAELADAALAGVRGMAESLGVELVTRVAPTPTVRGDRDRLIQVLHNLLSNALKLSPDGEPVILDVRIVMPTGRVRFSVVDKGPGISAEERPKLFDKFQQLATANEAKQPGTGLGLAISQAIVHAHQGLIDVDSVPGEGATFWFELPLDLSDRSSMELT